MALRKLRGQKTYWHLLEKRRMPSRYELVSSRLDYANGRGFEIETPVVDWYRRFQKESALACEDWEAFSDPRATTYASYVALQREREAYIDGLLEHAPSSDAGLDAETRRWVGRSLSVLRYPFHALTMAAAYLGQIAPGGRIVIAAGFQVTDEIKRVHRTAYRLKMLYPQSADIAASGRHVWETGPHWQPLREVVERLLVAYDFGECLTALNLCLKPALDELVCSSFAAQTRSRGDDVTYRMLAALADDAEWHRAWTQALVDSVLAQDPSRRGPLLAWIAAWRPRVDRAIDALAPALADDEARQSVTAAHLAFLGRCGLEGSP